MTVFASPAFVRVGLILLMENGGLCGPRSGCFDRRSGYFAGATSTCMKSPRALTLLTLIVVPVFGTFTPYQPGW